MPAARDYIDVSIPGVPLPSLTYAVPRRFEGDVLPGMRAVVPLGKRIVTGFIVECHRNPPQGAVKEALELPDKEALLSQEIIALCRWISRYYHAPLGDSLKAALPQGMDFEGERFISLQTNDPERIHAAIGKSKTKQEIIERLLTGEVVSEAVLKNTVRAQSIVNQLRELATEGIIAIETVVKPPAARIKYRKAVRFLNEWLNEDRIRELMEILEKRAPKQVNIVALLWAAYQKGIHSISLQEAADQARTGASAVKALQEKGVVEVFDEEVNREVTYLYEEAGKHFVLTGEQQQALTGLQEQIDRGEFSTSLLYGVTGSGKTQVYIEAIRSVLKTGKNALILVPEVSLTPQLVYRFRRAFGNDVAVMHSRLSIGERYDAWRLTREGKYRVVIGVRAAVFAPMTNLGIIIVDEEHEPSYKQSDQQPRFHARDAAVMRGWLERAVVVLGSATPSAESWLNAEQGKYRLLLLTRRIDGAEMPAIALVDMLEMKRLQKARGDFSEELLEKLRLRLAKKESSIVFQNRRGYAMHVECADCDYVPHCVNCSITLTYHKDRNLLQCHYCGHTMRMPALCPECGGKDIRQFGSGTQRLEEDLKALLPEARILRMDLDSTRNKGAHDMMFTSFAEREADILLGTQMVAKGLDLEHVTLVGVISAEQSLLMPDFRAEERTFHLLTQVAGRSGRGAHRGEVVFQALQPTHPVFDFVIRGDFRGFMEKELARRKALFYPPYSRAALITFSDPDEQKALNASKSYHASLQRYQSFYKLYPPQPAVIKRLNQRYRFQLFIRIDKHRDPDGSKFEHALLDAETVSAQNAGIRSVYISVDIDPYSLM